MVKEKGILIENEELERRRKEKAIYQELLKIADNKDIIVIDDDIDFKEIGAYQTGEDKTILLNVDLKKNLKRRNQLLAFNLGVSEIQESEDTVLVANEEYESRIATESKAYADKLIEDIEKKIII